MCIRAGNAYPAAFASFSQSFCKEDPKIRAIAGRAREELDVLRVCVPSQVQNNAAEADRFHAGVEPCIPMGGGAAAGAGDELEERWDLMFVEGSNAPVASELLPSRSVATKELVQRAWKLVEDRKKRVRKLSACFGNFDKVVALGWLLGDVLLGVLMPHVDALAVGRKAARMAPGLKEAFAAPSRRAGKLQVGQAREDSLAQAVKDEAALRQEQVELPLPDAAACRRWLATAQRRVVLAEEAEAVPATSSISDRAGGEALVEALVDIQALKAVAARSAETLLVKESGLARAKRKHERAECSYSCVGSVYSEAIGNPIISESSLDSLKVEWDQAREKQTSALHAAWDAREAYEAAKFAADESAIDVSDAQHLLAVRTSWDTYLRKEEERRVLIDKWIASGDVDALQQARSIPDCKPYSH